MSLSVLVPIPITSAMLTNSSAPETDYPIWSSTKAYAIGDYCISTATHRIYQCLYANTGKDPTVVANQDGTPAYWQDMDPTNRWAMFDDEVSTQTVVASALTITLRPGAFNALYLVGLDASHASIVVRDAPGGNSVFSYDATLEGSAPDDYDAYFWDPFEPMTDLLVSGIDHYYSCEVAITLSSPSGNVACGSLALGDLKPLGRTQYGAKAKPKTYSSITTDKFGKTQIVRRKKGTDMEASAYLDIAEANSVLRTIRDLLDVPAVWVGTDLAAYEGLRCYGLGSGEIAYPEPGLALLSLTVEGFI